VIAFQLTQKKSDREVSEIRYELQLLHSQKPRYSWQEAPRSALQSDRPIQQGIQASKQKNLQSYVGTNLIRYQFVKMAKIIKMPTQTACYRLDQNGYLATKGSSGQMVTIISTTRTTSAANGAQ